jgi:hypothetical protein
MLLHGPSASPILAPAGGNGGPLGDATIWPAVADWAGLTPISNPRAGDRAGVHDLGTGNSTGAAQWSGTEWVLVYAMFNSVADMLAFAEPIAVGALAGVEQSASDDETAVRYQWSGTGWARTPDGRPYVWTLTSIYDHDPSGLGLAQIGDVGFVGDVAFVLRDVALAVIGTVRRWVLYADRAATVTALAHLTGGEANATLAADLAAQGWTLETSGGTPGTITSDGTDVVLATTAASSRARISTTTTIADATRVRVIAELRADTPGTGDLAYVGIGTGVGGRQASLYYGPSVSTTLQFVNTGGAPLYASHAYRGGPVALPGVSSSHTLLTMQDDDTTVGLITTLGGQPYVNSRRLTNTSTVVFNPNGVFFASSPGVASVDGNILRIRRCLVYTV